MTLDSGKRPSRRQSKNDMWPTWMWIAIPVLVVVVVVAFWWALFADTGQDKTKVTPTPTVKIMRTQSTATPVPDPEEDAATPTLEVMATPVPPTATPAPEATDTPVPPEPEDPPDAMVVGDNATVVGTGGAGLNMRAGAGTGHPRIKTLKEGSTVELIGGPEDANGYTWWQLRDETGTTGWGADKFLEKK